MILNTREAIIRHYYGVEGGYVHDKNDLGGETGSGGITRGLLEDYEHLWARYGFSGDMTAIPYSLYEAVMTLAFWNKLWGDKLLAIDPQLIDTMYGWAINSGTSRPVLVLQKHLCVMNNRQTRYRDTSMDGGMGSHTYDTLVMYLDAMKNRDPINKLLGTLFAAQRMHYINISLERSEERNEEYTDGWINRIQEKMERLGH